MSTVWENKYQKSDRDYCNTSLDSLLEGIMWDRNNIPFNYTNDLFGWCLFNNGFKDVLVLGFCKGLYTDPVTLYFIDCDDGSNANEPVVLNTFIKVNGDINVSCIPSYHLELVHNSNSIHVITTYYGSFNNSNIGTSISNRVG